MCVQASAAGSIILIQTSLLKEIIFYWKPIKSLNGVNSKKKRNQSISGLILILMLAVHVLPVHLQNYV